ncbi:hypothetical protein MY04_5263 [Flammeovirga sp. MY04]|uniref:FGGY family carbohydrate kinase n=1 Tax=Flammeovirga sp. MY04 TaxID=1191459 RepID=UPI0008063925|nr:FGGY family carbohydrate kinase [Flammeovirga sp. MY04]ANQ52595.1 hypothetical protein MY04_5263 [Flammeovirga sp. MY04]
MLQEAIAVFDIGKTNKKLLIYNQQFQVIDHKEIKLKEKTDEDGSPCEDIDVLVIWMVSSFSEKLQSSKYRIVALNFSCYGASMVHLDKQGNRIGSFYNYLKQTSENFYQALYQKYGGADVFSEQTASPILQFLNSGLQLYWMKYHRQNHWEEVAHSLHFPQYLFYKFTGLQATDITSIGCHTALWDFKKDDYHQWVSDEELSFPKIVDNRFIGSIKKEITHQEVNVGIGIHDSTASIQPYQKISDGAPFLLISTGTWAINMNPNFNGDLSLSQLQNDCLLNINTDRNKILSSRYMLGRVHDVYCDCLRTSFDLEESFYRFIRFNQAHYQKAWEEMNNGNYIIQNLNAYTEEEAKCNWPEGESIDYLYHQLMLELTLKEIDQVKEIMEEGQTYEKIYISGGFVKNEIFTKTIATVYKEIEVSTLSLDNTSALGAALMVVPSHWEQTIQCDEFKIAPLTNLDFDVPVLVDRAGISIS